MEPPMEKANSLNDPRCSSSKPSTHSGSKVALSTSLRSASTIDCAQQSSANLPTPIVQNARHHFTFPGLPLEIRRMIYGELSKDFYVYETTICADGFYCSIRVKPARSDKLSDSLSNLFAIDTNVTFEFITHLLSEQSLSLTGADCTCDSRYPAYPWKPRHPASPRLTWHQKRPLSYNLKIPQICFSEVRRMAVDLGSFDADAFGERNTPAWITGFLEIFRPFSACPLTYMFLDGFEAFTYKENSARYLAGFKEPFHREVSALAFMLLFETCRLLPQTQLVKLRFHLPTRCETDRSPYLQQVTYIVYAERATGQGHIRDVDITELTQPGPDERRSKCFCEEARYVLLDDETWVRTEIRERNECPVVGWMPEEPMSEA